MTHSAPWSYLIFVGCVTMNAWFGTGCLDAPCPESPCAKGEVCRAGTCVEASARAGGCSTPCPSGTVCRDGQCVVAIPGGPDAGNRGDGGRRDRCTAADQTCNPFASNSNDDFLCVPWQGTVESARCAPVCETTSTCPTGSACLPVRTTGSIGDSCQTDDQCQGGRQCVQGTCLRSVCRPSECEGFVVGDETCTDRYSDRTSFEQGGRCLEVRNEAEFCVPAGARGEDESCRPLAQAVQGSNAEAACQPGLACVSGTCRDVCQASSDCANGEECIGLESEETVQSGLGQCSNACALGASDCGEGQTCRPVEGGRGRCVEAGDTPAFASCTPGDGECREGLTCVVYQQADVQRGLERRARCHSICDLSAGEADDDGTVSEEARAKRDATCPQPDPEPASIRLVHLADPLGAVDLYRSGQDGPLVQGLELGSATSGQNGVYLSLPAGRYDFSLLPEGAPSTDLPVAEWEASLSAGEGTVFVVTPDDSDDRTDADVISLASPQPGETASDTTYVRVAHVVADVPSLDIVATPPDVTPTSDDAVELGTSLSFGDVTSGTTLESGDWDLYLFEAGKSPRTSSEAVTSVSAVSLTSARTLFWHGTRDPSDRQSTDQLLSLSAEPLPASSSDQPKLTCMEARFGDFGYCRQPCFEGAADYGSDRCEGQSMGCRPVRRESLGQWSHLCTPVGEASIGDPCNPSARVGACGPGAYCLEYGNTRSGYEGGNERGLCHSYCATASSKASTPSCPSGEACQPFSYREDVGIGQCSIPCEPDANFEDSDSCPQGLRSCRPVASLQGSIEEGNDPPLVRRASSFCSASGDKQPGDTCIGNNCRPNAACLFERSEEDGLTRALLSQYYPAGSPATCRRRCDPFDHDDASHTCGQEQTCLFNYPISAEVGHCAELQGSQSPGESCEQPGLACGEDAICLNRGGRTQCLRFCDYEGPSSDGQPRRSTCPDGYVCAPFARDVGVCQRPQ